VCAASDYICPGVNENGLLPAGSDLGTSFRGTDVAIVAGQPNWKQLTASGQLTCNETAAFGKGNATSEKEIAGTFQGECPEIMGVMQTPDLNAKDVKCTAACVAYISNLGACQSSNAAVQQVRCNILSL
jgi:hypothetical protein